MPRLRPPQPSLITPQLRHTISPIGLPRMPTAMVRAYHTWMGKDDEKSEIEAAAEPLQSLFTDQQARDEAAAADAGQVPPRRPQPPPEPEPQPWWKLLLSSGGWILGMLVLLLVAYDTFKPDPPPPEPRVDVKQRFQNGAYVTDLKQLSPTEELSLLVVPSTIGEYFDTKCLIYKNREFNQVLLTCPQTRWLEEPTR